MTKPGKMKKREDNTGAEVLVTEKVTYHWDFPFQLCTQHKKSCLPQILQSLGMLKKLGLLLFLGLAAGGRSEKHIYIEINILWKLSNCHYVILWVTNYF